MSFELDLNSQDGINFRRVMKVGIIAGATAGILLMLVVAGAAFYIREKQHGEEVTKLENEITRLSRKAALSASASSGADGTEISAGDAALQLASEEEDWCLALVNSNYPLDEEYVPELVTLEGTMKVDKRILDEAKAMLEAARDEGLNPYICSAYRSVEDQEDIFNNTMYTHMSEKLTALEAYAETRMSVALPGCSEHAMGLALDIVSSSYVELDEKQADTKEAQWFAEHCWEYGFILRYPPEKSDITGIIYEPWHYRYVGKEAAKEIMEKGMTLEEYLGVN